MICVLTGGRWVGGCWSLWVSLHPNPGPGYAWDPSGLNASSQDSAPGPRLGLPWSGELLWSVLWRPLLPFHLPCLSSPLSPAAYAIFQMRSLRSFATEIPTPNAESSRCESRQGRGGAERTAPRLGGALRIPARGCTSGAREKAAA